MDKYLYLQPFIAPFYSWLEYIIGELDGEFKLYKQENESTLLPLTTWVSLEVLDQKLEELWKQKQSKEAHSDSLT